MLANRYENYLLHDFDQFMFGNPPPELTLVAQVDVTLPLVPRAQITRVCYTRSQRYPLVDGQLRICTGSQLSDEDRAVMDAAQLNAAFERGDTESVWFPPRLLPATYTYSETDGSSITKSNFVESKWDNKKS